MPRIASLSPAAALTGAEIVPLDQGGSTVQTTAQDIANLAQAGIQFKDEGVALGTPATATDIDFVGAGVTATRVGNAVTVTVAGGTGDVVGPATAVNGNVALFDTTTGKLLKDGGTLAAVALSGDAVDVPIADAGAYFTGTTVEAALQELGAGGGSGAAWGGITALSISSGVVNIDLGGGRNRDFTLSLTANVTSITFSNLPASGYVGEFDLLFTQDATGGRTVALPAAFKALGGSDTSVSATASSSTLLSAKTFTQGTTWRYAMQESS